MAAELMPHGEERYGQCTDIRLTADGHSGLLYGMVHGPGGALLTDQQLAEERT